MPLSGQIGIHATLTQTPAVALDLGVVSLPLSLFKNWDMVSGVAADQADQLFSDERSLATGANEDLDLAGTFLQNAFGVNITFVKLKAILFIADPTNTTNLTLGNAASNAFQGPFGAVAHTLVFKPGDFMLISSQSLAAWAVTPTTADLLRVTNAAGATAKYKIVLVGTTA